MIADMSAITDNPFAVLSVIAAPAVMTNASSILILSTSNRLARAVDQTRSLLTRLNELEGKTDPMEKLGPIHLKRLECRTQLLGTSLTWLYVSLGAFASACLISVLGASTAAWVQPGILHITLSLALVVGCVAIGSLVYGCMLLVRETRIALLNLTEETAEMQAQFKNVGKAEVT